MNEKLPLLHWQHSPAMPEKPTDTQITAANRAKWRVSGMRLQVFDVIRRSNGRGHTDSEIQHILDISGNSERPRRRELELGGYIMDSGLRRLNRQGNEEIVWTLTELGQRVELE